MLEAMALKIVKQHWLLEGVTPTPRLTDFAKRRIQAEIMPFLGDVAEWAVQASQVDELPEKKP